MQVLQCSAVNYNRGKISLSTKPMKESFSAKDINFQSGRSTKSVVRHQRFAGLLIMLGNLFGGKFGHWCHRVAGSLASRAERSHVG